MRFEDLNWFDVQSYLENDDRLILVIGSCEQHAYLSLLTDVKIPFALAEAASKKAQVLLAPPVNFGISPYFLAYPGTLSIRVTTLMDLVEDLIRSAYQQGFRRFLIMNGHGGNDPVRGRLYELANQLQGVHFAWYAWWTAHSVEQIAQKYGLKPSHANWLEAFPFTTVADLPAGEKNPPYIPGLMDAQQARQVYGDGQFGGAYQASSTVMHELFAACLEDVLKLLNFD